jgi:hypothetical protein
MPLTRDAVLTLMQGQRHPICPTCLSKRLRIPFMRVFHAVLDIQLRREYPIREGMCSECDLHQRHVLWPPAH